MLEGNEENQRVVAEFVHVPKIEALGLPVEID